MKRIKYLLMAIGMLITLYVFGADIWRVKSDESQIAFSARSTFTRVHGKIPGITGDIRFSENDLNGSWFNMSVEAKNLDTDNKKRDNHLRSADFLDVEKFPLIKFKSKSISKSETGFSVTGDLTIKDVTKEISFPFSFENQGSRGIFKGSFSINRREYHVGKKTRLAGDIINIDIVTVVESTSAAEK
jgi:polyisoprenoid-binding protein YceI